MIENRKYAVLIGDGMADTPISELGNRTPLEAARTPNMDALANQGILGLARTIPDGMSPGSDTANLSIFGYDPRVSYTGRAPLEAINMGIKMLPEDVAFRCNIVDIRNGIMEDFSGGHIESAFSGIIMTELGKGIRRECLEFHPGVSYRNILLWRDYPHDTIAETTPPHDIHGKPVADYLPAGAGADILREIMSLATRIISESPAVKGAVGRLKGSPQSVWLWGGGRKPAIEPLKSLYGLSGFTISAVDLIHGIGRAAGLSSLHVEGATGYIDTNYEGKAEALLNGLRERDIVFLHVESPDESGHEGSLEHKIRAIEDFDEKVVGRIMTELPAFSHYAVMVLPDHPTPLSLRTHTADPVPFCIFNSDGWDQTPYGGMKGAAFSEKEAAGTGLVVDPGHRLLGLMIRKKM